MRITTNKSNKPYKERALNENTFIREFSKQISPKKLVWHRDAEKRTITVIKGAGWQFQRDNKIPVTLNEGDQIKVEAGEYHRLIKGNTDLFVSIVKKKSKLKEYLEGENNIQDQLRESTSIDQLEKFKQDMIQSYKQIIRLNRKDHIYIAMDALKDLETLMRMNEFQLNQFFKQESGFRDDLETFSGHQAISNGHDSADYFASQISNTVNSVVLKFGPKQLQSIVNEIYASNPSDPQIPITDDYGKIVFYFKIPTDISNNIEIFLERLVLILNYELVDMLGQLPINEAMTLLVAYCEVNDYELDGLYAYEYEAQLNKSLKISSAKQKQDTYNCLKSREIPEFADFIEPHLSKGLSIIKEEYSLNEIFNTTDIYPFEQRTFNGHNDNKEYAFTTKDNLFYKVGFRFTNGAFSIDFYVDDMHVDGYAMTNKLDFKVYSTVAAIARYYDETTNASIAKVYTFDANAEFPGDKRRERAYIYILEKNGFHVYYDNYGDVCFKSIRQSIDNQISESSGLLNEIFNTTDIYPFTQMSYVTGDQSVYSFTTKDDLEYHVKFEMDPWRTGSTDISFYNDVPFDFMSMTNKNDLKVYSTIVAVVRHFDETSLPGDGDLYSFQALEEFDGDQRRERTYVYILKQNGFETYRDEIGNVYFNSARQSYKSIK